MTSGLTVRKGCVWHTDGRNKSPFKIFLRNPEVDDDSKERTYLSGEALENCARSGIVMNHRVFVSSGDLDPEKHSGTVVCFEAVENSVDSKRTEGALLSINGNRLQCQAYNGIEIVI
jgi:hypothetical protein